MTMDIASSGPTRRSFIAAGASAALAIGLSPWRGLAAAEAVNEVSLRAAPSQIGLLPNPAEETSVWAYNDSIPGPEIRVRQGERLRVLVENGLEEESAVHWHGIRLPNAMDGVPYLTQPPIGPGESFLYEFDLPDAGTFWYHPHLRGFEQVGRGLSGALIIEEREPLDVDRDVVWALDDWRLTRDGSISPDFGNAMDMAMAGRIGNMVTINGKVAETLAVRAGERIRLRLVNTANARIFGLNFRGHEPEVLALDGHPVEPYRLPGRLILGPGERADLIIDMIGEPGVRYPVIDNFYWQNRYKLLDFAYTAEAPLRRRPRAASLQLPPNPVLDPDVGRAERHEIVFGGGMGMGSGTGDHFWSVNGVSMTGHQHEPFLTLARNEPYVLAMRNSTLFHHPIHFHGHTFRLLSRNGRPSRRREWQDTVLTAPNESIEIGFVADNPGDWMIHCHVLEHQAGGMMGVIRVV
jgi:FtsP/CotA-like multicopper oxidase with cupredoxin domain